MTEKIIFDYRKLRGKIKEKYNTQDNFAKKLGISISTLNQKINNNVPFTHPELSKIINILDIKDMEIKDYFFIIKV